MDVIALILVGSVITLIAVAMLKALDDSARHILPPR
jgi:hypothetical protein